ncbi:MAG: K(+)-transporting ATPase subunit C [Muribaculaceae bacterium]
MKTIWISIKITVLLCIFFAISYVLILWIFAKVTSSNDGNAEVVTINGAIVGAANVGQQFTQDIYFWGRPSNAGGGYDGTSSSGSNKGVTNEEYLKEVNQRIDTFLLQHPYLERKDVPAEMVTASASGLDPDITPECAYVQVKRVASARKMSEKVVLDIVNKAIEQPLLGLFGPAKINVLKLNVELDKMQQNSKGQNV